MAGHAQLKLVMTECSKTQIRLTGLMLYWFCFSLLDITTKTLKQLSTSLRKVERSVSDENLGIIFQIFPL